MAAPATPIMAATRAAPAKPTKKQQRQQKQVPAKTSLCSPFSAPRWSPLPQADVLLILRALREGLHAVGLQKTETNPFRQWRKKKPGEKDTVTSPPPVLPPSGPPSGPPRSGWTVLEARRQLAIGINEVTRALERNRLSLVLVCRSVKPGHMTNHLIALSRTRAVPACQVPQLSATVGPPLGLRSVLALGFRHGGLFADTVDAIAPRVPALFVEWITDAPGTAAGSRDGEEAPGTAAGSRDGEREESGGRKRTFEETKDNDDDDDENKVDDDVVDEDATKPTSCPLRPTSCPLQPLKVKKIVPNPLKKRKQKKNKKKSKA